MPERRLVKLFRNGRSQAVRIPGDRLVIELVRKRGLVALLKTMKPLEESFPDIHDPAPEPI
jgi:antitoxin VapB